MVKHTQTIRRRISDKLFEWFDHLVGLELNPLSASVALDWFLF